MTTRHKMSLAENYVKDWGMQEALRELFQNAIDWGNWSWSINDGELNVVSHGAHLSNKTLLLGHSDKKDGSIGKFGEGYKLAMLVLCRLGYNCWIENHNQQWVPKLINSRTYGCKQLVFDVDTIVRDYPTNSLVFIVQGLSAKDISDLMDRNLHVRSASAFHSVTAGSILSEDYAGKMFVGGLYVCTLPEFKHGYNFEPTAIELDRDRRMLRGFDVSWLTSTMWMEANDAKYAASMVKDDCADVKYVESQLCFEDRDKSIAEELVEEFVEEHGEGAVPVHTQAQAEIARLQGHERIVIVPKPVYEVMRKAPSYSPPAPKCQPSTPKAKLELHLAKYSSRMSYAEEKDFKQLIEESEKWYT